MKIIKKWIIVGVLAGVLNMIYGAETQKDYPVRPVPFTDVSITDKFWAPRIETNRKVTIPYAFKQCEETGRMDNFVRAARVLKGDKTLKDRKIRGYSFDDTDPYKILEGASFGLSVKPDPRMENYLDDLIEKIAAAQEPDGYLYTARTINPEKPHRWAGNKRWVNVKGLSHELYNMGHLYEAAVAHYRATGKRSLLNVATKNSDLLCKVFGPGKNEDAPGHQIIEMGLVRLYQATGKEKYLKLAKFFLDTRGPDGGRYSQAHKKILDQDEAVGHAVRATYMYSGIADVAALTGDLDYVKAIDRIWQNVVSKKLYLTGGIGAAGGHEGFAGNYELPNMSAYCETCAAIGNVYWNHRLFLLHDDAKYIDVMERTLYNGLISGVSLSGDRFFYPNPLESQGQHSRSPWFGCACCPGNIARFIASVPGYVYAHRGDILYVNLFAAGTGTIKMENNTVKINQQTRYPWDGTVKIKVNPERSGKFEICVRIPGWAQNRPIPGDLYRYMDKSNKKVTLKVNGKAVALDIEKGFARMKRKWKKGDRIELNLPMPIRRVLAHKKVEADKGKVALERGPIVYCAEWPDNGKHVTNLLLPDDVTLKAEYRKDLLNGITVITGKAQSLKRGKDGKSITKKQQDFLAIPYYSWAHRGRGEMTVWLARDMSAARPLPGPTIASTSRITTSGSRRGARAINDQMEPKSSDDHSNRYFHWWPRKGTTEWVQYDFEKPEEVYAVEVYWFDDTGQEGECRVPKSWRILYRDGQKWRPVYTTGKYGVEKNKYNKVTFETVKTDALRLEVQLPEKFSASIHEWRVK